MIHQRAQRLALARLVGQAGELLFGLREQAVERLLQRALHRIERWRLALKPVKDCTQVRGRFGREDVMALNKYIIERDIPEREQLAGAAAKSNEVLAQLGPDIQWVESYVAANKTFCVYLAKDEDIIHKHAEISGFPATKVTAIGKMIDPTTEKSS